MEDTSVLEDSQEEEDEPLDDTEIVATSEEGMLLRMLICFSIQSIPPILVHRIE